MSSSGLIRRAFARLAAVLVGVVAVGMVGLPVAHASTFPVDLVLAAGQSGSIGRVVSNTDVTPVSDCDSELSVSFDATMAGTVTVASDASLGSYGCLVDFQIAGQSTNLSEQVSVTVVPRVSIKDLTLPEGDIGIKPPFAVASVSDVPGLFTFTVVLSEPSTDTVTVAATTVDGTATAQGTDTEAPDYTAVDTTVTFPPGATTQSLTVLVNPDHMVEPDETFSVVLSEPTGAVIGDGHSLCTVLTDDIAV